MVYTFRYGYCLQFVQPTTALIHPSYQQPWGVHYDGCCSSNQCSFAQWLSLAVWDYWAKLLSVLYTKPISTL